MDTIEEKARKYDKAVDDMRKLRNSFRYTIDDMESWNIKEKNIIKGIIQCIERCFPEINENLEDKVDEEKTVQLEYNEIKVGDIVTYFKDGEKGIMLVTSSGGENYPRCKFRLSYKTGIEYGDFSPEEALYCVPTKKEKRKFLDSMADIFHIKEQQI